MDDALQWLSRTTFDRSEHSGSKYWPAYGSGNPPSSSVSIYSFGEMGTDILASALEIFFLNPEAVLCTVRNHLFIRIKILLETKQ